MGKEKKCRYLDAAQQQKEKMLRKSKDRKGQPYTLVSAFCHRARESVCKRKERHSDSRLLESCVSVQSDPGPRRLGEVDGWTPARSTAITLSLAQGTTLHTLCICTLKTHTKSMLSSWHAWVETAQCAWWEEWMVMIAPERKTYRQTGTKSLRSVFNV